MLDHGQDCMTCKCTSQKYISDSYIPTEIHVSGIVIQNKVSSTLNVSKNLSNFYGRTVYLRIHTCEL
jgi:hypothetical protein